MRHCPRVQQQALDERNVPCQAAPRKTTIDKTQKGNALTTSHQLLRHLKCNGPAK
jgi:hypothetical protein